MWRYSTKVTRDIFLRENGKNTVWGLTVIFSHNEIHENTSEKYHSEDQQELPPEVVGGKKERKEK